MNLRYTGKTIPYTELPPADPDDPDGADWETYRREVGRLLAEGHEGKAVLIHGGEIVALFPTWEEAARHGSRHFPLEPTLAQVIRSQEPLIRGPIWLHAWHAGRSQSKPTG